MKNQTNTTAAASAKNEKKTESEMEIPTDSTRVRFAFVPIVRQFRSHTQKNQARLWIPIETSLLVRYEFASCSLQTRYIFVAIVLFCGANGIEEIPLDAKFMSSVLIADERTIQKSFEELLGKNLLVEREKREKRKEETDRANASEDGVLCVDSKNLSQAEKQAKPKTKQGSLKIVPNAVEANKNKHSEFSIEECLRYVEVCQSKGEAVNSPKALANHLHKTGEADAFILATLYPAKQEEMMSEQFGAPVEFSDEPCRVCFGAKMADADGKGFRACEHCKNERGKSTGLEPKEGNENVKE